MQSIDIAAEVHGILLQNKPHLKWYKNDTKWDMVYCPPLRYDNNLNSNQTEITLPQNPNKSIIVTQEELHTLRTDKRAHVHITNRNILLHLLDTIDILFNYYVKHRDRKQELVNSLNKQVQAEKNAKAELDKEYKAYKVQQTKNLRSKMAELEQSFQVEKSELLMRQIEIKKTNNELMKDLNKLKKELKHKATPKGDENDDQTALYIEQLTKQKQILKHELSKCKNVNSVLTQTIMKKDAMYAEIVQELNIWRGNIDWITNNVNTDSFATAGGDDTPYGDDFDLKTPDAVYEEEEKKEDTFPEAPSSLSISKSAPEIKSLSEFQHKYSRKNLKNYKKSQLIKMIGELHAENGNLKQELRENILGVSDENCFLNIEELLNQYIALRTQTHSNLHNRIFDELEKKHEDAEEDVLEKCSYQMLYHVIYLSDVKISQQFTSLYTNIGKMIKIQDIPHSNEVVARVMHSVVQAHYKELMDSVTEENGALFNLEALSLEIYEALRVKYKQFANILSVVKRDIIGYAQDCLQMVGIIKLYKPKLRFENLSESNSAAHDKYDDTKHENCGFDYEEYNENDSQLSAPKYIQYYCFPGLSIANDISKIKRKQDQEIGGSYVLITKSQVVC